MTKQMLEQTVKQKSVPETNPVPSRITTRPHRDAPTVQVPHSVIANGSLLRRARNLPERPELSEGIEAYRAWLDAMEAHVRHMAQRCAAEYHREQLAHHAERLAELEGAA